MIKELSINDEIVFNLKELKKWESLEISWNKIITVISWEIKERQKWVLKTFESSVYHTWEIVASKDSLLSVFDIKDLDIILNKINVDDSFWEFCRANWTKLCNLPWCETLDYVDLYRWDQVEKEFQWVKYKFNLWFCWKDVDCLFHNKHNFEEIHTNIAWDWFMQKSLGNTDKELLETVWLMPWSSHRAFNIKWEFEENWNPKYPIHRWLWWKTWNIWFVIEKYKNF